MKNYEINEETVAVIGVDDENSKIIEVEKEYLINSKAFEVMDHSCKYFGSSYHGRVEGSRKMIYADYKLPIIVEESSEIIFFPLLSIENNDCIWIALKWYKEVYEEDNKTYIKLKNNKIIECNISKNSIKNQVMRASRLNLVLNERKCIKN